MYGNLTETVLTQRNSTSTKLSYRFRIFSRIVGDQTRPLAEGAFRGSIVQLSHPPMRARFSNACDAVTLTTHTLVPFLPILLSGLRKVSRESDACHFVSLKKFFRRQVFSRSGELTEANRNVFLFLRYANAARCLAFFAAK